MDRGSEVFSIFHCKSTLNRGRALSGLFFHPSPWAGSDRQASVPPGADKSPVNQTGMLRPQISTVAQDEDVPWAVGSRTVWTTEDIRVKLIMFCGCVWLCVRCCTGDWSSGTVLFLSIKCQGLTRMWNFTRNQIMSLRLWNQANELKQPVPKSVDQTHVVAISLCHAWNGKLKCWDNVALLCSLLQQVV